MDAWNLAATIYGHPLVKFVLGLMAANILTGVAVAARSRDFRLGALGDWLMTTAIPYLLGAGAVQIVLGVAPPDYAQQAQALGTLVWGIVLAALLGKVIQNLRDLGMPLPEALGDKAKPSARATP